MLVIDHLTLTLRSSRRVILQDFSLKLNPGERYVLIGEEGNGKSTLLRAIHDPAAIDAYAEMDGRIDLAGSRTGWLAQECPPDWQDHSVFSTLSEQSAFWLRSDAERHEVARQLGWPVERFYSEQPIRTLSGGEKVRLQLAALLLDQADVLLLDEPSNDLDLEAVTWLETFLCQVPAAVLFISHDEWLIDRVATGVVHLEQIWRRSEPRHTVAAVPYAMYRHERQQAFAHQTQVARKQASDHTRKMEHFRQIYQKVEHQQETITRANPSGGRLLKKKIHALKSLERRLGREEADFMRVPDTEDQIELFFDPQIRIPAGKEILDLHLPQLVAGERILVQNPIALRLIGPERVCLIGANGTGKTTLLRQIRAQLCRQNGIQVGWMPQNYAEEMDPEQTALAFLAPSGQAADVTRASTLMGSARLSASEMRQPLGALSGGQKAKLFLIRLVLSGANVLLLDEPTRNLSPLSQPAVRDMLAAFGGAILLATHDRALIADLRPRLLRISRAGLEVVDHIS